MHVVQSESRTDLGQFLHETVDDPQRVVVGTVGLAAAELVVEDDAAMVRQCLQRLQVMVCGAGTAVQAQQRRARAPANVVIPDPTAWDIDIAFAHARASRTYC